MELYFCRHEFVLSYNQNKFYFMIIRDFKSDKNSSFFA